MKRNHKRRRGKSIGGVVTDAAIVLCRDVVELLGGRDTCVVAGCTIVRIDAHVAKGYAREA